MDRRLVEAALSGNETTLNALIHEDPLILHRISLTSFDDTPLHIAALCGNLNFVTAILCRKPEFLIKLDSFGRSPLHLACAEGHVEIVKRLFQACPEVSERRDQDGRTPLELAALNEQVDVMIYLIQENPLLPKKAASNGKETILHLCIRYNSIRALKLLVNCWNRNEVIIFEDGLGNNLLHFAVIHKQIETVKYLLGEVDFGENLNSLNKNGFTAIDVLEHCPRDWRSLELHDILMRAGVQRAKELKNPIQPPSLDSRSSLNSINVSQETAITSTFSCSGKVKTLLRKAWHHYFTNENNWVENIRGNLLVTATLIAAISFQAGLNPPGGVFQDSTKDTPGTSKIAFESPLEYASEPSAPAGVAKLVDQKSKELLGTSIFAHVELDNFRYFLRYNTMSLISSLSIIFLMISGFPLNSRAFVGVLMVAMSLTMFFMLETYIRSVYILTPDDSSWDVHRMALYCWYGVCTIVALLYVVRFLVWLLKKVPGLIRCQMRSRNVLV